MSDPGFRYLNLENRWPLINATARPGLVIRDDGALSLARTSAAMNPPPTAQALACLLYTSDAAAERSRSELRRPRIHQKKTRPEAQPNQR